ncbi:MAG: hypothetical protein IPM77_16545 [Crocinitomicaceae bacterium]|nr:hypothetical protein [Crocinitomicaceae bacterium]
MKALSYLSVVLGILSALAAIYLAVVVAPEAESASNILFSLQPDNFYGSVEHLNLLARMELKITVGVAVLFGGILALILGIYPAVKKNKLGLIGLFLGIISALVGAAYGTHMFS